jgi:hypothetical protein
VTDVLASCPPTAVAAQQSGTSGGPKASAGVVTDAKFKKLKKRVAALEAKVTPTIPASLCRADPPVAT